MLAPQADLILLHAFELPFEGKLAFAGVDEAVIAHYVRVARQDCREKLHHLAAETELMATDYSAVVTHGDAAQKIIAQEKADDCDLIVVGKHGTHLTEELLLGSVTKHVLLESQCDVLAIPDRRRVPEKDGWTRE